ncbi:DUF6879 family protein [Streptomyces sp. NBC_00687]|uniref:DUF6879 family protein n=1 Tax=Streptomyces sp. NBC_00687 TaxID=2975807 RepID=UPI002250A8C3|nr:DUF6879 family protein [Streptomyces sp. NBC_00687]MCX4919005.1 hypothetical protein [Streptomyces sp. NBC_00687]
MAHGRRALQGVRALLGRGYATDRNSEAWARWKAGQDGAHDAPNAWRRNVAEQTGLGKRFGRVRVVDEPLTEEQAFLLTRAPSNVAAGDEVRYLLRRDADRLGLPELDFSLIDSRTLLTLVFDDADTTLGVTNLRSRAKSSPPARSGTPPGISHPAPRTSHAGYGRTCEHRLTVRPGRPRRAPAQPA